MIDYHIKHNKFPGDVVDLTDSIWPDLIVLMWVSLFGVPAFLTALYLFWIGAWFTMGLIVISVILGGRGQ